MTGWELPPIPDYWPVHNGIPQRFRGVAARGIAPPLVVEQGRAILDVLRQAGAALANEQTAYREERLVLLGGTRRQWVGYVTDLLAFEEMLKVIPDGSIVRGSLPISMGEAAHYSVLLYAPSTPATLPFALGIGLREVETQRLRDLTDLARRRDKRLKEKI